VTLARVGLRFFVFLLIFVLEVRVKAAESPRIDSVRLPLVAQSALIQQPRDCLKNIVASCAIATNERQKFLLDLGGARIWLDQNTSLVRLSQADTSVKGQLEVRLLKGTVWVETTAPVRVSSEFGAFFFDGTAAPPKAKESGDKNKTALPASLLSSQFWVRRENDRMVGSSVHQVLQLQARGTKEILVVPEGLENWIGRIGDEGEGTTGVPMPIVFADHIQRWARLFVGKNKAFEADVEKFHKDWLEATQLSADINQKQFERRIASLPVELPPGEPTPEKTKPQPIDRRKQFNAAINAMFRRKVLSGE